MSACRFFVRVVSPGVLPKVAGVFLYGTEQKCDPFEELLGLLPKVSQDGVGNIVNCRLGGVSLFCEKYRSFVPIFLNVLPSIIVSLFTDRFFGRLSTIISREWSVSSVPMYNLVLRVGGPVSSPV